ncbi:LOW QUALITY PROTEIN: beta-defensin 116 [Acomys russatus]|uniref:LOW QUALITY PROTEIN: beta-defensin 116 n=1 Tax=Acomys russatus TaxID=60746 RepID=UPI0021E221EC|nr:LOW QUALITY PROTEIN: beta-defensin 116 [Acomys russatus]
MTATKPYFMMVAILLILVDKTTGGLFGSRSSKRPPPWMPCEVNRGVCRNTCKKNEIEYLTCSTSKKCCLKYPMEITSF